MADKPKFLRVFEGEVFDAPPVWFMRQAGRYLPEYRELRAKAGSFLDLCYDPDLASEVTLQPIRRFDLDAAILFADILLIPDALGQKLTFVTGEGPQLAPLVSANDIERYRACDVREHLAPVFETVAKTRAALSADKALIGFAGAPWTVATYMLAGGPVKDPAALRLRFYEDRKFIEDLIDVLTEKTIDYLNAQIEAGADAVQLFDTWASGLPWPVLDAVSVRPLDKISRAIKKAHPETPVIFFPKGVGEKAGEYALLQGCDGLGIDYAMDPSWARANLGGRVVVQGGLDPLLTVSGGDDMERAAQTYLKLFHDVPYIFNLGHGFTPQTPPENVARLVEIVRGGE
ncbi:uroporphyrinogen decarboxylase [Hyphococcus sp.]|uniref:uroporphyrinogen decarboxylase n=1 Tax=Hyphococcus sp. TaxID=2038636 RepID=UPI003CCBD6C7